MKKATLGFRTYKIWLILKRFTGTFRRAQTLKLGGVMICLIDYGHKICLVSVALMLNILRK